MIRIFEDLRQNMTNIAQSLPSIATYGVYADIADGCSVTGNGAYLAPFLSFDSGSQYLIGDPIIGHKYYLRMKAKVTNSVCASIEMQYGGVNTVMVATPTIDTVYDVSAVITATATTDNVYFYERYASAAIANGKVLEVYNYEIIDLTADYSAGLEPELSYINTLLTSNSITYFDGTYPFNLNDFTVVGDKVLHPSKCVEVKQDNEDWYVEVECSAGYIDHLEKDYLLIVPTKQGDQPFRVGNIENDGKKIFFKARHVGYDLENYVNLFLFGVRWIGNTLSHIRFTMDSAQPQPPFTYSADGLAGGYVTYKEQSMLGNLSEIVQQLGGHLMFDWWNVQILNTIGADRDVEIRYGKNLEGAKVVEDWSEVCTELIPLGNSNLTLNGTPHISNGPYTLYADVTYSRPYARQHVFQTDDVVELETLGNAYLEKFKAPKINYTVSSDNIQDIALGDTIKVVARQFTILTNVLGYTFDALTQRIKKVEFGNFRKDVRSVFSNIQGQLTNLEKKLVQETITMRESIPVEVSGTDYRFLKYFNGTLELFGEVTVTTAISTANGSGYYNGSNLTITYPTDEAFIDVDYAIATVSPGTGGTATVRLGAATIAALTYLLDRMTSATSASYKIRYHIVGKWK